MGYMNMKEITAKEKLKQIDEADVDVNDWEADFIESCLDREFFTKKQKAVIDKMYKKYV